MHDLSVLNEAEGGQAAALLADLEALVCNPFEACEHVPVPDLVHGPGALPAGGLLGAGGARPQEGLVKGYVDRVEIALGAEIVARHRRSYVRGDVVYDPLHYCQRSRAPWTRRRR